MIFNPDALNELYEAAADKIIQKMVTVRNDVKSYERSWIWELIQNAKDNVAGEFANEKVSIFIKLSKTDFHFSHNHGYFTRTNVEGIVRQVNKKDVKNDNSEEANNNIIIGRFGTGFMTTHLLSPIISVKALFQQDDKFKKFVEFTLDRSDIEKSALVKSITNSFDQAKNSVDNATFIDKSEIDFSQHNSIFSYKLDDNSYAFARKGIEDLHSSLPFTLVFVNGIKQVQIDDDEHTFIYIKSSPKHIEDNIFKVNINVIHNGVQKIRSFIYLQKEVQRQYKGKSIPVEVRIAIEIEEINNTTKVLRFTDNLPYIFLDFPLIGTENFDFPAIINFPLFGPTEPRDGVYLEEQGPESIDNQEVFVVGKNLLVQLLNHATQNNWLDIFNLAKSKLPAERKGFSRDWFKNNVQSTYRNELLNSPIVETESSRIFLKDAKFPYNTSASKLEQIWELTNTLHPNLIPKKEHINDWNTIIDSKWAVDLRYDLRKLVIEIAQFQNITNLSQRLSISENETLNWLNGVIGFAVSEEEKLLNEYRIIPNQKGNFLLKDEIWFDDSIPNQLKEALNKLSFNWFDKLQHINIIAFRPQIIKNTNDIVTEINARIKSCQAYNINPQDAVFYLLSCNSNDTEKVILRNQFYKLATEYYNNFTFIEQQILNTETNDIWEECDKWFVRKLFFDISVHQNLDNLNLYLKFEGIEWLDKLILFTNQQKFEAQLNDFAILPNQKGDFKKKKDLFIDDEIDENLKVILENLGFDCKSELLNSNIMLDKHDKIQSTKEIATKICDKVMPIYRSGNRDENTKQVFALLFQWLYRNPILAEEFFGEVYDKRYLILRTDEETIDDIEFKQNLLNNKNGYTENEILKIINTPKNQLLIMTNEDLELEIKKRINEEKSKNNIPLDPDATILSLGITNAEDLAIAQKRYEGTKIGEALRHFSSNDVDKFTYVQSIIRRAKGNVKQYLGTRSEYNITNWQEDSFTVIKGVIKDGRHINIVIRPADGGQIIIFYSNEFDKLEEPNTELWYDNDMEQGLYSFGRLLKRANINRFPL